MSIRKYAVPRDWVGALASGGTVTVQARRAVLALLVAYALSVGMMALARVVPSVLAVPFVVVSLSFVPGTLVILALAPRDYDVAAQDVLYAFGTSLLVLMLAGAAANLLLPYAGVSRPMMPVPLGAAVTLAVAALALLASWRNPAGTVTLRLPPLWSPAPLGLLLLPLLSIIGVSLVNATGVTVPLAVVLIGIGLVPVAVALGLNDRWHPLAIWTVALAVLYHKSLWQYAGFGGRPHGITAWEAGRWSPGIVSIEPYSSELLQNGVLFPLFARLSDLFIMTQYEVVNPFLVSFIPLALYVTFRRYVRTDMAFLAAATFVFVHPFYLQYPTAGRAATPVLFLALFAVALSNDGLSPASQAALGVSFLTGVVVTHYGTSYYVAAAFVGALGLLYLLWTVDSVVERLGRRLTALPDGGTATAPGAGRVGRSSIFSPATVSFFVSAALGWYFYTRQGWKFDLLPKHIYDNLQTLVTDPTSSSGRTAARVQETYVAPSIELSKQLYILLAVLMAVGFAAVYLRRVTTRESSFDDGFLVISTSLFVIFGSTLVLSNWGGGRPMMITFSFTTVFAVVGAVTLAGGVRRALTAVGRVLSRAGAGVGGGSTLPEGVRIGATGFAALLAVLLMLNTGVAAAAVLGGAAPSNVPAQSALIADDNPQSQVTVHRGTDIATHVWLVQHLDPAYPVHGDTFAARQFDWYRPDVAARTAEIGGGYSAATKPEVFDVARQRNGTQPGYVLVMGHNLELGAVYTGKAVPSVPLGEVQADQRNRIYTTGESHVYFYSEAERDAGSDSESGEPRLRGTA